MFVWEVRKLFGIVLGSGGVMKRKVVPALLLAVVFVGVLAAGSSPTRAQGFPSLGFTLYQGSVTVAGQPAEDGLEIKARILGTS